MVENIVRHLGHQGGIDARQGNQPVDVKTYEIRTGNVIIVPENSVDAQPIPPQIVDSRSSFDFDTDLGVTTTGAFFRSRFLCRRFRSAAVQLRARSFGALRNYSVEASAGVALNGDASV